MLANTLAKLKWLFLALIFIAVLFYTLTFVLSNTATTSVNFILFEFDSIAVELLVLASFVFGGLLGLLSASVLLLASYRKNKRLKRQYAQHMG